MTAMADGGTAQLAPKSRAALRYHVEGMDCPSCASKIETAVGRFGGAEDIRVNYHSRSWPSGWTRRRPRVRPSRRGSASSATASPRSRRRGWSRASTARSPPTYRSFAHASPGGRGRRRGLPRRSAPSWWPGSPLRSPSRRWTTGPTYPPP
ncbi:heavy-metal-associated domain-containing protein [Teichococcus aestuarii]